MMKTDRRAESGASFGEWLAVDRFRILKCVKTVKEKRVGDGYI